MEKIEEVTITEPPTGDPVPGLCGPNAVKARKLDAAVLGALL